MGRGHRPLQDPSPSGKGDTPSTHLTPQRLDPRAYGARTRRLRRLVLSVPLPLILQFDHWWRANTFYIECNKENSMCTSVLCWVDSAQRGAGWWRVSDVGCRCRGSADATDNARRRSRVHGDICRSAAVGDLRPPVLASDCTNLQLLKWYRGADAPVSVYRLQTVFTSGGGGQSEQRM